MSLRFHSEANQMELIKSRKEVEISRHIPFKEKNAILSFMPLSSPNEQ
jgi:hypothetical protein